MSVARRTASSSIRLLLIGSIALTDLSGCMNGGNMFSSAIDPNDVCGVQHRDFADSRNYWLTSAASGAVQGAFTGAAVGALLAWARGGNVGQGAGQGAAAGAVIGASAKYYEAKQKEAKDEEALSNSVYEDVRKASTEYDRVSTTFGAVKQCRFQRAALIKSEYKEGTLTQQQAATQLADQKKRMAEEIELAKKFGQKMADQDGSFRFAAASLAKDDPAAQAALTTKPKPKTAAAPTPSSDTDYTIKVAANVRQAPDASSARVAGLFPGAKVEPEGDAQNGWRKIKFNGGTEGYVLDKFIAAPGGQAEAATKKPAAKPAAPVADTGTTPPAASTAEPADVGDKKVAVATMTGSISEKRESYDSSVAGAESDSNVAFNLGQSTPPG